MVYVELRQWKYKGRIYMCQPKTEMLMALWVWWIQVSIGHTFSRKLIIDVIVN